MNSFYVTAAPKEKDSGGEDETDKKKKKETGNKDAKVPKEAENKSTGEKV